MPGRPAAVDVTATLIDHPPIIALSEIKLIRQTVPPANAAHHQHHSTTKSRKANSHFKFPSYYQRRRVCRYQPHGRSRDRTRGSEAHIRCAKIVNWHPVSIINATSVPSTQPVRNQGAPEPTAPTTMASLFSLRNSCFWSAMHVSSWSAMHVSTPVTVLSNPSLVVSFQLDPPSRHSPAHLHNPPELKS